MTGNVGDLWEVVLSDDLPAGFGAAGDVFEHYYARVFLPNTVALSDLAFGAGFEFGAIPALTDNAVNDYITAAGVTLKNVDGVVTGSPLASDSTPPGGQDFWLYVKDTSTLSADERRTRRGAARQTALGSLLGNVPPAGLSAKVGDTLYVAVTPTVDTDSDDFVHWTTVVDSVGTSFTVKVGDDTKIVAAETCLVAVTLIVNWHDSADLTGSRYFGCGTDSQSVNLTDGREIDSTGSQETITTTGGIFRIEADEEINLDLYHTAAGALSPLVDLKITRVANVAA